MKIFFIGTVKFSEAILCRLVALKSDVVGVLAKEKSIFNSDFADLKPLCIKNKIDYICSDSANCQSVIDFCTSKKPDVIFCFGWPELLSEPLLKIAGLGVIGYHPTLLPKNRGRHPLIWALALGLEETGSTFFFMDKNVDSGDILSQRKVPIKYEDNAGTLYHKITDTAISQMEEFMPLLEKKSFKCIRQDESLANCWRRRTEKDGEIDWRMSSRSIYNLVRALVLPYCGAHFMHNGKKISVWEAEEIMDGEYGSVEPGKIINTDFNGGILIKTGQNCIRLPKEPAYLNFRKGECL